MTYIGKGEKILIGIRQAIYYEYYWNLQKLVNNFRSIPNKDYT
jgi:hypothetical protein